MRLSSQHRGRGWIARFARVVGLMTIDAPLALGAQAPPERALRLVAMVEAHFGTDERQIGAGIITGTSAGRLYIATARHVVQLQGRPASAVTVRFRTLPGESFRARLLDYAAPPGLDLAILAVTDAPASQIIAALDAAALRADHPATGEDLYFTGQPNAQRWKTNVTPAKMASMDETEIRFESPLVTVGNSGGPLFDREYRLVGMVVQDQTVEARALPIGRIASALRDQQVPFIFTSRLDASKALAETRLAKPEHETATPRLTTVTLAYAGDPYGCALTLQVRLGDRTVVPTSNAFPVENVPLGRTSYHITGTIGCYMQGVCQATGDGAVDVEEGLRLFVIWQNVAVGRCTVILRKLS